MRATRATDCIGLCHLLKNLLDLSNWHIADDSAAFVADDFGLIFKYDPDPQASAAINAPNPFMRDYRNVIEGPHNSILPGPERVGRGLRLVFALALQ
jgi:hypothetical protein